jgi:hypothetical protein
LTDVRCELCARPDPERATVCRRCGRPVEDGLRLLARLGGEATTTIARLARLGHAGGRGDGLPWSWEAADATWAVANTLTTWARHIAGERGITIPPAPGRTIGPLCRGALSCHHPSCTLIRSRLPVHPLTHLAGWLAEQVVWLRHRPEAREALDELGDAARLAARTVDNPPDRWYAGPCGARPDGRAIPCEAELYPVTGVRVIRCPDCGTRHDPDARRDWLLDLARDQLAHAGWLASALTRLTERTVSAASIRGLAFRGRITAHGVDESGRPLYQVGEVWDIVRQSAREREAMSA